ncbi:MAG: hypothetical protein AB1798_21625, partial [Spirochaetota bacterium]
MIKSAGSRLFLLSAIFIISATVISLQIVLMRELSIVRYHHFSYLVISTALLGFGGSGTFLVFSQKICRKKPLAFTTGMYFLFITAIPVCNFLALRLPIDIQYLLYSKTQFLLMVFFNFLIFLPFFFGAAVIGWLFSLYKEDIPLLYGSNLVGSGAGGLLAIGFMYLYPPHLIVGKFTLFAFLSFLLWIFSNPDLGNAFKKPGMIVVTLVSFSVAITSFFIQPEPYLDGYKALSRFKTLEKQGDAQRLITRYGPRGEIDIYASQVAHRTLFVSLNANIMPPPQLNVLIDGDSMGAIFRINDIHDSGILDFVPQTIVYHLFKVSSPGSPRVLLLGEIDGTSVWLARRFGAAEITVVQANPQLISIIKDELAKESGAVFNAANVQVVNRDPRLYIQQTQKKYDIIQVVGAESIPSAMSGVYSLHEDYLLTVEAITRCYEILSEGGFISITRGIQTPPRDNIKLFAMAAAAVKKFGVIEAGNHLLQSRNYLAVNTLVSKKAVRPVQTAEFRKQCERLLMDMEYYPGIQSREIQQINQVEGPEGTNYSYYHFADMQILSDNYKEFFTNWKYNISPPTDDKPYFHNFFKWRSLKSFIETYGPAWFRRVELGYMVLVITFAVTLAS